ncbi:DUF5626 family protein [Paenibacillus farraposensis]|uniref:DUF5626 family protein n=1 Tax=Paenibacillus farraposensis TaxID=2807095 RepID=A0ABW4DK00_9BACL|nr:DUF5626 family protein [Paenibacillus farraposensis]MCC3378188.1 DUF5626 family protein [Paenibacillus farraposensis]
MKRLGSVLFALFIFAALSVPAFASPNSESKNDAVTSDAATFDLNERVAQEVTVKSENGDTYVLGVKPVDTIKPSGEYPNATGTYKVYWYSGVLNGEYYININSSYKITRAYDPWHSFLGYDVTDSGLEYTSTTARGWWDLSFNGWSNTRWVLSAQMNGSTLKTWVS